MYRNAVEGITNHSDLPALSDNNVEAGTWHSFLLSLSRWGAGASASAGTGDRRSCSQQPRPGLHGNIGECMLLLLLGWLMKFWRL